MKTITTKFVYNEHFSCFPRPRCKWFSLCYNYNKQTKHWFLPSLQGLQGYEGNPNPYQFSYSSPSIGGESSHQESGDGSGRVQGSYSVVNEDGSTRVVEYVADEYGFRPTIRTNEPGTANLNPADVNIESTADNGYGGKYKGCFMRTSDI